MNTWMAAQDIHKLSKVKYRILLFILLDHPDGRVRSLSREEFDDAYVEAIGNKYLQLGQEKV